MANYNVDLQIAVKGAKELQRSRVGVKLLQKEINKFNLEAKKGTTAVVKNFDNLSKVVNMSKRAMNTAAIGTTKYFKAIDKTIDSQQQFNQAVKRQQTDFKVVQRLKTKGLEINHKNIQLVRNELAEEIKLARAKHRTANANKAKGKSAMMARGLGGGLGNAVGSGIIGGGFPLLFGQGPTAALGGALGGLGGGMIGGQFGFALSIAGTTIGSALDDLAKSLAKPTENIEKLVSKFGLVGTETGDLALELEKLGLKTQAAELLLKEGQKELGLTTEEMKINTEKMQEFENSLSKLGTQITLFLANHLTPFLDALSNFGKNAGKNIEEAIMGPGGRYGDYFGTGNNMGEKLLSFIMFGPGGDPTAQLKRANKTMGNIPAAEGNAVIGGVKLNPEFGQASSIVAPPVVNPLQPKLDLARKTFEEKELLPLKQALELEKNRLTMSSEKLALMREEHELINLQNELEFEMSQRTDEVNKELEKKIEKLEIARDTQAQVVENTKALMDPLRQVSGIIAQDIGDGIKGLIRGTSTLGDTLNNVLNKMIDGFLNLGLFGNFGGTFERGSGLLGGLFGRAAGGPVKKGGSYIVGERGPEMFSPGVSGTITPNHALGGSTTVIVNVDATGSNVEGDEQQGRELGRLISVAVQSELVNQKRPGGILA